MQTYETALAAAAAPAVDRASRSGTVASVAMAARAAESEPESNRSIGVGEIRETLNFRGQKTCGAQAAVPARQPSDTAKGQSKRMQLNQGHGNLTATSRA